MMFELVTPGVMNVAFIQVNENQGRLMREIVIDGKGWTSTGDVYDSFFEAVGAPHWHGRNFNALRGIGVGQINRIKLPYVIRIKN